MSADEFDPFIEQQFSRTPALPDAALFNATVERRLQKGSNLRVIALTAAGLVGGLVAVRETVSVNIDLPSSSGDVVAGEALGQGIHTASAGVQTAVQSGLDQVGLGGLEIGAMGGMQLFWIAAALVIAGAAAGVMRLSQDI